MNKNEPNEQLARLVIGRIGERSIVYFPILFSKYDRLCPHSQEDGKIPLTTELRLYVCYSAILPLENLFFTTIQIKIHPLSTDWTVLIFVFVNNNLVTRLSRSLEV